MSLADALIASLLLIGLVSGWKRGFLVATLELVAVAAGAVVAYFVYGYPAWLLSERWPAVDAWIPALCFATVFIMVMLAIASIGHGLLRLLPARIRSHRLNRTTGVVPGLVNGALQATVAAALLGPLAATGWIAPAFQAPAAPVQALLSPIFDPALRSMRHVVSLPDRRDATVALDFRVAQATERPELEARLLELVNAERARHGLSQLRPDPELTPVAREHGRDMFARGYFSHYSPEGQSMDDRLKRHQVRYLIAGENLALARSLDGAHEGLMKSPGHRANILRPQFGRLGIGVLDGGRHGLMVTQNFRD